MIHGENSDPSTLEVGVMNKSPTLFSKKSNVELPQISKAQTPLSFGGTQRFPTNPVDTFFIFLLTLPKLGNNSINISAQIFW